MKKYDIVIGLFLLHALLFSCAKDEEEDFVPNNKLPVEQAYSTGLPVLTVNTSGRAVTSKEDWIRDSQLELVIPGGEKVLQTTTSIRGRGNVTWKRYPKKPYNLKLSERTGMLGMKAAKRWVLLANWADRTLLRNDVTFEMARRTSLEWTPRGEPIELILNGTYMGAYYLCEKVQADTARLRLTEEEALPQATDYLMEMDAYYDEEHKFRSAVYDLPYEFRFPDDDKLSDEQFAYMKQYIRQTEETLYSDEHLMAGRYEDWIDAQSFVDWWIVNELVYNKETGKPRSVYVYKRHGERLKAGPVWDFDFKTFTPQKSIYVAKEFPYLQRLFLNPQFQRLAIKRWQELRPLMETIPEYIDSRAALLERSQAQNILLWPISKSANGDEKLEYAEAIERMKSSILLRMNVIDEFLESFKVQTKKQ